MAKKPKKRRLAGGVDTHKDTHHAAVVLMNRRRLADAKFPATAAGHADLVEWMRSFGRLHAVGVEGTGSYGAGLALPQPGHLPNRRSIVPRRALERYKARSAQQGKQGNHGRRVDLRSLWVTRIATAQTIGGSGAVVLGPGTLER
jgi:hypothetical protein